MRCGWLFIDTNVDIMQQSIPIPHARSAKALLCGRKALTVLVKMRFHWKRT